jgi:PAS domain S-box-containing protein
MSSLLQSILSGSPGAERPDDLSGQLPELRLIYDTAPIGLAFLAPDCRYLQINQRLTKICGISVAEHIGRSVRETVPQVADQVEKIVELILSNNEPITGVEVNGQRCRSIVEAHGGRLWASAAIPHGSVFHVALPRANTTGGR